jgi:hypothetical protein
LVRQLPDGRRAEVLQDRPDLVRVVFYTAETGRVDVSYKYDSVEVALKAVSRWVDGKALDGAGG